MRHAISDFRLDEFRQALALAGAIIEEPTNEWEILRYRLGGKFQNAYRNAKGRVTLCGKLISRHYENFLKGRELDGPPQVHPPKKRKPDRRRVELHTDASSYHTTKAAAWAAILITPDGEAHEAHGPLKGEVHSSTSAETRAIANGLWHFIKEGLILRGDAVTIVCDNSPAVGYVNGRKPRSRSVGIAEAVHTINTLKGRCALSLAGEWIKGHQPARAAELDKRVIWNRRCDALAKAHGSALHLERKGC